MVSWVCSTAMSATSSLIRGTWHTLQASPPVLASALRERSLAPIKDAAIAASVQNYAELFFRLQSIGEKLHQQVSSGALLNQVHRNELAELLEEFIEIYHPSEVERNFLAQFCKKLRDPTVAFDQTKIDDLERFQKILHPHFEKHRAGIEAKCAEQGDLKTKPGITTAVPVKLSHEEKLSGIEKQFDLLKSNSISMVLGIVILNMTLGRSTVGNIDLQKLGIDCRQLGIEQPSSTSNLVNFLIAVSNKMKVPGKNPGQIFQMLIHQIIDNSDLNILARTHAKLRCDAFAPLISNFVGNLLDNIKGTILDFAKLPPAEQLREITELLIDPLLAHLTALEEGLPAPQPTNPKKPSPIDALFAVLYANKKTIPKTPEELLDRFIEVFLNRSLDPIYQPWTRKARKKCLEKAAYSPHVVKAFFLASAAVLLIAGKLIAPFQWILNETVQLVIKKIVVGLCPGLSSATKSSLQIGKAHPWHSLKNSLLVMLQQIRLNRLLPRTEDPSFEPDKDIPPDIAKKWTTLIDRLLKQFSGDAGITRSLEQTIPFLKGIIVPATSKLALQMCAQEGFMSGILHASLSSTNNSLFAYNSVVVPTQEKERVAKELDTELGLLGELILEAVQNGTRSDKSYQRSANVFVTILKQEIQAFHQSLLRFRQRPEHFESNVQNLCLSFAAKIGALRDKIGKAVDASTLDVSTQGQLIPLLDEALRKAKSASNPTEASRIHLEAKLADNPHFLEIDSSEDDFREWVAPNGHIQNVNRIKEINEDLSAALDLLFECLKNPLENKGLIEDTLSALKALDQSLINIDALVTELTQSLQLFEARSKHTTSASTKPLFAIVADYKDLAHQKAQIKIQEEKIKASLELAADFRKWAESLRFIKITSKPTAKDAAMAQVYSSRVTKSATRSAFQTYGKNLFAFIDDEDNLTAIAVRGMSAFLKKFSKQSREERRKVATQARQLRENPSQAEPLPLADHLEMARDNWEILSLGKI